jgi:hypothetical protein
VKSSVAVWVTLLGAVGASGCSDDAAGVSANSVLWEHGGVRLEAEDFYIEIEGTGVRYRANVPGVVVGGNPGNPTFKTLELEWREHGTAMRLYIYFEADASEWQSYEIRTYDGAPDSDGTRWVYYYGPFFQSAIGSSFVGDVDLTSDASDNGVVGRLHFANLRLTAF